MYQNITQSDFHDAFRNMGREDQFSYEARNLLFEFLEEMQDSTGEPIELDVIALCCEFYESSWDDIASDYSIDLSDCEDDDEREQAVIDYLQDNTLYVGQTSGTLVYQAF